MQIWLMCRQVQVRRAVSGLRSDGYCAGSVCTITRWSASRVVSALAARLKSASAAGARNWPCVAAA